jgi:hypothetical protein
MQIAPEVDDHVIWMKYHNMLERISILLTKPAQSAEDMRCCKRKTTKLSSCRGVSQSAVQSCAATHLRNLQNCTVDNFRINLYTIRAIAQVSMLSSGSGH